MGTKGTTGDEIGNFQTTLRDAQSGTENPKNEIAQPQNQISKKRKGSPTQRRVTMFMPETSAILFLDSNIFSAFFI